MASFSTAEAAVLLILYSILSLSSPPTCFNFNVVACFHWLSALKLAELFTETLSLTVTPSSKQMLTILNTVAEACGQCISCQQ